MANAKVEKVLITTATPLPGDKEPKDVREMLATALRPLLAATYTVESTGGRSDLLVRRTPDSAPARVGVESSGHSWRYRSNDFVVTVGPVAYRSKETRRYPVSTDIDRLSVPTTFSYRVNMAGVLVALGDALTDAERKAEYDSEAARNRRTTMHAAMARTERLGILLGIDSTTRDEIGLAPFGLEAKVGPYGALTFDVTIRVKDMTPRKVAPYLALFPDAALDIRYGVLKLGGISEADLDHALWGSTSRPVQA